MILYHMIYIYIDNSPTLSTDIIPIISEFIFQCLSAFTQEAAAAAWAEVLKRSKDSIGVWTLLLTGHFNRRNI